MKRPRFARPASFAILAGAILSCVVLTTVPAGAAASAGTPAGSGWLRFAHFVSNAPPVDVKVDGTTIGTDVGFRDVTGYVLVNAGVHTVTVFNASAGAGAAPIVTGHATVPSGGAVTVAAFASTGATSSGSGSVAGGITLQPFADDLSPPPTGYAKVRLIHTIPGAPSVTTQLDPTAGGSKTPSVHIGPVGYKEASSYVPIAAGTYQVEVKAPNGSMVAEGNDWSAVAGTVISIVVVEASSGPTLEILSDAAGTSTSPNGAAQTGFGGTAARPSFPRMLVLPTAVALLVLLAMAGFLGFRPNRRAAATRNH